MYMTNNTNTKFSGASSKKTLLLPPLKTPSRPPFSSLHCPLVQALIKTALKQTWHLRLHTLKGLCGAWKKRELQNPFVCQNGLLLDRLATWQNTTACQAGLLDGYLSHCQASGCTEWAAGWFLDCLSGCWLTEWAAGYLLTCLADWLAVCPVGKLVVPAVSWARPLRPNRS